MLGKNKAPADTTSEPKIIRQKSLPRHAAVTLSDISVRERYSAADRPGLLLFTLIVIYKNLYILGITILRRFLRLNRKARFLLLRLRGGLYALMESTGKTVARFFTDVLKRLNAPFARIHRVYMEQLPNIRRKREAGKIPLAAFGRVMEYVLRMIVRVIATIINYTIPVLAVFVLIVVIRQVRSVPLALEVHYKDSVIGYIENESKYEKAMQDVRGRLVGTSVAYDADTAQFQLVFRSNVTGLGRFSDIYTQALKKIGMRVVEVHDFTSDEELANEIIRASGIKIAEAYGLYVDNRFYGAVTDKDAVLSDLQVILDASTSGKKGERVAFEKSIRFKPGFYPEESIVGTEYLSNTINSYETVDQIYTVQKDDTPTGIADKTGVPFTLLREINPDIETTLMPGMEIKTAVARPFLSVKSIFTDVYEEEYAYKVVEKQNATYARGYREVTKKGVPGTREVTAEITVVNGIETGRREISARILTEPVDEIVVVGVNNPQNFTAPRAAVPGAAQSSNGGFIWPTSGGYITCYLGGYPGHTGVDIGRPYGAPVYASASGTVILAKNTNVGYGRYIIIDHGNNYRTLYGHNSQLYVSVGDVVAQGQVIAAVGSTGRAYGNHLHFEVIYNGKIANPVNYIGG